MRQAPERRAGDGWRSGLADISETIMRHLPIFAPKAIDLRKTGHAQSRRREPRLAAPATSIATQTGEAYSGFMTKAFRAGGGPSSPESTRKGRRLALSPSSRGRLPTAIPGRLLNHSLRALPLGNRRWDCGTAPVRRPIARPNQIGMMIGRMRRRNHEWARWLRAPATKSKQRPLAAKRGGVRVSNLHEDAAQNTVKRSPA